MPRGYPNSKPVLAPSAPPRKKRSFFSSALPLLEIVRPPSPSRAVPSDRVLAALQTDAAAVVAAKNFVANEMGDDKYEIVDKSRVTRDPETTVNGIEKTIPIKRKVGRPRKVPLAKPPPKRIALGSGTTIAQRLKEKTKGKVGGAARALTLRSNTTPRATESTPTPAETVPPPPVAKPAAAPKFKLSLTLNNSPPAITSGGSQETKDINPTKKKEYMDMGFYCQDAEPPEEAQLVERVLHHKGFRKPGRPRNSIQYLPPIPTPEGEDVSFPPLPLDHGYVRFFGKEQDFVLPYYMIWERESGALDGKKRPPSFGKLRTNQFVERSKRVAEGSAVCRCDPSSECGDNCMNRIMSYLCGKDCPCGDRCHNKSLTRRKPKSYKIAWTGSRGFGVFAGENISEGDFVMDYRGEIIDIETFIDRIDNEYKGGRNFYALHYDGDEVIDAGLRGNDARFINHGCNPNLEVRKYQTLGDGFEEYEVGFWATRNIRAGEELLYDYNFESFSVVGELTADDVRVRCQCGAPNCIGFLSRKSGEKSAKELAKELEAKAAGIARKADARAKRAGTASMSTATAEAVPQPPSLPVKRGVGRPRKESLMPPPPLPVAPVKRGPGRPRKESLMPPPSPAETPVKRGPGRPRKESLMPTPSPAETPVKRGPGRPRKHSLPVEPVLEPVVKRKPGRPRKIPVEPVIEPVAEPVVKRKPGRPRKHPLPDVVVKVEQVESEVGPIRSGPSTARPAPYPVKRGPGRPRKHPLPTPAPAAPAKRGPGRPRRIREPEEDLPVLGPRITPKQAEKAKRNGAPAGWTYLPIGPAAGADADAAAMPPPPPLAHATERARMTRSASVRLGPPAV